ncbi:uncharacterized protein [Lepeophtheirus salmonis]|uniref:uncharacterized protein n=1 Tax=Lepeophtheirus salmonis TaxID=72036 RepID=UPI001AEAAFA8|nr:uncharacterized protein LOC121129126 [Lepeophtheirus salmonis]
MSPSQKVALYGLLSQLALFSMIEAHRCFVCIPSIKKKDHEVLSLIKEFSGEKIRRCEEFHDSAREDFIKECPEDSVGCLTQFQGNSFLRSCARLGLDVCKEANNVTYCYCSKNECNTPESRLIDPTTYLDSQSGNILTDDEDFFESSGGFSSTFTESNDFGSIEEEVTEFPTSIIPTIDIDTNINNDIKDEIISKTSEKDDFEIVLTDDYIFENEEKIDVIEKAKPPNQSDPPPSSPTENTSSSLSSVLFLILPFSMLLLFNN